MNNTDSLTKSIFQLIQLKHHLAAAQKSSRHRFICSKTLDLPDLIKPAVPDQDIVQEIHRLTEDYTRSLEDALDSHYSKKLARAEEALPLGGYTNTSLELAFQAAAKRARDKYGKKLSPDVISTTASFLKCSPTVPRPQTPLPLSKPTNMAVKGQDHPLSNFWKFPSPTHYRGFSFSSGEQLYQFSKAKFFGFHDFAEYLLTFNNPSRIKQETKKFFKDIPHTPDFLQRAHHWDTVSRPRVTFRIFNLKFQFHSFKTELQKPGFFYHPVRDAWWGTGSEDRNSPQGPGRDQFGRLLMAFRFEKYGIPTPLVPIRPTKPQNQENAVEAEMDFSTPPTSPPPEPTARKTPDVTPRQVLPQSKRKVTSPTGPSPPPQKRRCQSGPTDNTTCPLEPGNSTTFVMGDSNIARFQTPPPGWALQPVPGAKIETFIKLLAMSKPDPTPEDVIIYVGVNNHADRLSPTQASQLITQLHTNATKVFPNATVHLPQISHVFEPASLESNTLFHLETARNQLVPRQTIKMPRTSMADRVHWSATSARLVLKTWADFLAVAKAKPQRLKTLRRR